MSAEPLFVVGLSYLSAHAGDRERAAVPAAELSAALEALRGLALRETVVLSTCSRVEVYGLGADAGAAGRVREWFRARVGEKIASMLYEKRGDEAVAHLFRVAAGLDSWIVGETEILAQVKTAYQSAFALKATGPVLNRVFQTALSAGKAVRAGTGIQNGIHSIGGAAALLVSRIFKGGTDGETLVFGAGQAAEAVVRHLSAKEFKRVSVANRTLEKAEALAAELGGTAVCFDEGFRLLERVEAVVFSVSTPEPLLDAERLAPLLAKRERPLFIVDLGLPRNVHARCSELPGVYLYDLDHLEGVVRESMERKAAEKGRAEVLAAAAVEKCVAELEKADRASASRRRTQEKKDEPQETVLA
ncbi:MAG: glutamyl-tRNA reductase [Elusimicrobiota bacterium]